MGYFGQLEDDAAELLQGGAKPTFNNEPNPSKKYLDSSGGGTNYGKGKKV